MILRALAVVLGSLLVATMLADAIGTLIVTRGRSGRWRPTRLWYLLTWRAVRATSLLLPKRAADLVLNVYPAMSLLGLLLLWLAGEAAGWGFLYWGLGATVAGSDNLATLMYYAGTSLVAAQFGVASGALIHALSLVETVAGLGTVALLISYLPALYGAYSRREAKLLTLDHPQGGRLVPAMLIAQHAYGGNMGAYHSFCREWETWTAEILESHVSYPMLATFRSRYAGQSWITALGVVVDSATFVCALINDEDKREPYLLHRRGRRTILDIADRLDVPRRNSSVDWLTRENLQRGFATVEPLGLAFRDLDDAFERLQELYGSYGARLQDLIDFLLAPHGFWGHSAEDTVQHEVAAAEEAARVRARSRRHDRLGLRP